MLAVLPNVVQVSPADYVNVMDNEETYARTGVSMDLVSSREDVQVAARKTYF